MKRFFTMSTLLLLTVIVSGVGCLQKPTDQTSDVPTTTPADEDAIVTEEEISFEDEAIDVVTEDVYGKDLDLVERYPDSVRSYYASNEYESDVTYQTTASQEDIRAYYDEQLTAAGWTNSEEATDYMEYVKGDEDNPEILTLYLTEYTDQGIVEYELVYEPALTDEELLELEDETFEGEF